MTDTMEVGAKRPQAVESQLLGEGAKRLKAETHTDEGLAAGEAAEVWQQAQVLQASLLEVDNATSREMMRLQREENTKKEPLYAQRGEVLRSIESFWLQALTNSDVTTYITDHDRELLQCLDSLHVSTPDETGTYSITLTFAADNPILRTPEIIRTLTYNQEDTPFVTASCSPVEWKTDLRTELDSKGKPLLDSYSFLSWFLSEGEFQEGEGDTIAEEIRESIWPNPIHFYLGGDDEVELELQEDDDAGNVAVVEGGAAASAAYAMLGGTDALDAGSLGGQPGALGGFDGGDGHEYEDYGDDDDDEDGGLGRPDTPGLGHDEDDDEEEEEDAADDEDAL